MEKNKKIIILGSGFGGIEIARSLANQNHFDISLVSNQEHFVYYPALYELAALPQTAFTNIRIKDVLPKKINIIKGLASKITKDTKTIEIKENNSEKITEINYDILIVAVGSITADFGIPGVKEHMCQFRTFDDIHNLRSLVKKHEATNHLEPIIIVGGGPTGIELAAGINESLDKNRSTKKTDHPHVYIVEGAPRLVSQLDEKTSSAITKKLRESGISIYTDTRVLSYDGSLLKTNTGDFATKTVVWAAGLGAHPLLSSIGNNTDKRGRLVVNDFLQYVEDENIYVIGDAASTTYSGLAQTAIHHGSFVAKNIIRKFALNKSFLVYKPTKVGYAVPVGSSWGIASMGSIHIKGLFGFWIRKIIDFKYLVYLVGLSEAITRMFKKPLDKGSK